MSRYSELVALIEDLIESVSDRNLQRDMRQHVDRFLEDNLDFLRVLKKIDLRAAKLIIRELRPLTDLEQLCEECEVGDEGRASLRRIKGVGEVTVNEVKQALQELGSSGSVLVRSIGVESLEERIERHFVEGICSQVLQTQVGPTDDEMPEYLEFINQKFKFVGVCQNGDFALGRR